MVKLQRVLVCMCLLFLRGSKEVLTEVTVSLKARQQLEARAMIALLLAMTMKRERERENREVRKQQQLITMDTGEGAEDLPLPKRFCFEIHTPKGTHIPIHIHKHTEMRAQTDRRFATYTDIHIHSCTTPYTLLLLLMLLATYIEIICISVCVCVCVCLHAFLLFLLGSFIHSHFYSARRARCQSHHAVGVSMMVTTYMGFFLLPLIVSL